MTVAPPSVTNQLSPLQVMGLKLTSASTADCVRSNRNVTTRQTGSNRRDTKIQHVNDRVGEAQVQAGGAGFLGVRGKRVESSTAVRV